MGFGRYLSEKDLEHDVVAFCREHFRGRGIEAIVIQSFGLDVAIFVGGTVKLIELKAARYRERCALGTRSGGNQVRLLYDMDGDCPRPTESMAVLDRHVRWLICDRDQPIGSRRFSFFDCSAARENAMRGVRPGKHNNFRGSCFNQLTDVELEEHLSMFLDE